MKNSGGVRRNTMIMPKLKMSKQSKVKLDKMEEKRKGEGKGDEVEDMRIFGLSIYYTIICSRRRRKTNNIISM